MPKTTHSANLRRGQFNTLAQSGTDHGNKPSKIITGMGSDLTNTKAMKGRVKRKVITQKMALGLIDASAQAGDETRKKSYWNTYHCQNKVYTVDGKLYSRYCKNRHCTLCCSIRKAAIINSYLPTIQTWEEPYLVTLTVKSIPHNRLKPVMQSMVKELRRIIAKYRKQHQRGGNTKLVGVRSLESNFNPKSKKYNPHFHIIVANKAMADIITKEWLMRGKKGWVHEDAQNQMKVFNNVKALIEVVKYGSKICTEPDVDKKMKVKGSNTGKVYIAALNNIFNAMKGMRIFERFGFDLPDQPRPDTSTTAIVKDYCEWEFHPGYFDWINPENGYCLTDYSPPAGLVDLLENRMDTKLV